MAAKRLTSRSGCQRDMMQVKGVDSGATSTVSVLFERGDYMGHLSPSRRLANASSADSCCKHASRKPTEAPTSTHSRSGPCCSAARPSGASTPQEAQLLARDVPGPSGGEATVQGIGERSTSSSSPQTAPVTDRELHCSAEIAAALQDHLSKPHVYEAVGHTAPPSIPVSAVEDWLSSAWIVARS